ncbi:hypothetical protein OA165_02760, partial [Prochlorococcus sp. AH-736-A21]|nr:hypothetical protein [Prochlorococcus sp. AH-736-A21]
MISRIPITNSPNVKNILRAFLFLKRNDGFKKLSRYFPNYHYIAFARSAISLMFIYKMRIQYENNKKPLIFLPDYFCNESTRYLRAINANIKFYPFKSIDKEFLTKELMLQKGSIFLFVNYFGQNNYPKENIFDFLKKKDIWIIEDSTHQIFSKKYTNKNSDFILLSPHKIYSIPNGAIMLYR